MELSNDQKQKDFLRKYQDVNRKMEEDETAAKAAVFNFQYVDLTHFPVDLNALGLWDKQKSEELRAVAFYKEGTDLRIGAVNPNDKTLQAEVAQMAKEHSYKVVVYYISEASFNQAILLYSKVVKIPEAKEEHVVVTKEKEYLSDLKNAAEGKQYTATELLTAIFGRASQLGASDVHVEPEDAFIKLRFRLDGVLVDIAHLPKSFQKTIISRVKILSHLKLNVDNVPQDGRFTYQRDNVPVDVRVSILPSAYGEGIVMRILNESAVSLKFEDLGLRGKAYDVVKKELVKPNGMIITTGPTGSGKTTTLYAFLNQLNEPGVKIITLEDPVEYKLQGISQTPIDAKTGLSFAQGLRAILRQDPDIVMVGEIRDAETADVALQAALTGHVVLSTLHTNDAAGAIPRLLNMGVKPFVVAPGLNAIIAQRLVRKLCNECKKPAKLSEPVLAMVKKILSEMPKDSGFDPKKDLTFFTAPGCKNCNSLGYKGRLGIYEVIPKTEAIEKLIMSSSASLEIRKTAIVEGMVTMAQDGLLKALEGITDVEEVFRVTQE